MKNTIILICCTLSLICCKQTDGNDNFYNSTALPKEIKLDGATNQFILDFILSVNNADCIYELYIDKKTEDEYFLTLFNVPIDTDYVKNHFPVNYTSVGGKVVFVYSGIEDFVNKKDYSESFEIKDNKRRKIISYETISKVIQRDTAYIAGDIGIPFIDVKFTPSVYDKR